MIMAKYRYPIPNMRLQSDIDEALSLRCSSGTALRRGPSFTDHERVDHDTAHEEGVRLTHLGLGEPQDAQRD